MAVFGRRAARQRVRESTQQAHVPPYRSAADCTPWVLGGLWPTDLAQATPETASIAEYLKRDLQRIADSANEKLRAIGDAGLPDEIRQSEEYRVINVARAFAVLRVESTVRQLRKESLGFGPELLSLTTREAESEPNKPEPASEPEPEPRHRRPEPRATFGWSYADSTDVAVEHEPEPAELPTPTVTVTDPPPTTTPAAPPETDEQRLRRTVDYVARQIPGLRWAAGIRSDGTAILTTDLAHGWIPAGVDVPDGVELLTPQRRTGNATALLGHPAQVVTYSPGDPFGARTDDVTVPSTSARRLDQIDDLGWQLAEATHWRDGLPRMVHTLAKVGSAGTGVLGAEVDVLRVHLDTAGYQLIAQYPNVDHALLLNCLLLAATEALAGGDTITANYHYSWFTALSAPPASSWGSGSR